MSEMDDCLDEPGEVRKDMSVPELASWLKSKGIPDSFC